MSLSHHLHGRDERPRCLNERRLAPHDHRIIRKLGKAYFFQYFGEGRTSAAAKAEKTLEGVREIQKDDAEPVAYLGALAALESPRSKDRACTKPKASTVWNY